MALAPWKVRVTADGSSTLGAVHATVELVNRAVGTFVWPWAWFRDDTIVGDPVTDWNDRTPNERHLTLLSGSGSGTIIQTAGPDGTTAVDSDITTAPFNGRSLSHIADTYTFTAGFTLVIVLRTPSTADRFNQQFFTADGRGWAEFDWFPTIPEIILLSHATFPDLAAYYEEDLGGSFPVWTAVVAVMQNGQEPSVFANAAEMSPVVEKASLTEPVRAAEFGVKLSRSGEAIAEMIVFDGVYDPATDPAPFGDEGSMTINEYLAGRYPSLVVV